MAFDQTYTLIHNAPSPMEWMAYTEAVSRDFRLLLESRECEERTYQEYLERHPSLLPWTYGTFVGGIMVSSTVR
jgi:hypothetical protein